MVWPRVRWVSPINDAMASRLKSGAIGAGPLLQPWFCFFFLFFLFYFFTVLGWFFCVVYFPVFTFLGQFFLFFYWFYSVFFSLFVPTWFFFFNGSFAFLFLFCFCMVLFFHPFSWFLYWVSFFLPISRAPKPRAFEWKHHA